MIDISIKNVVKSFEIGAPLLDGFSMELREGERVGLLGRNGCGKTTLFRMITGQLLPDEGEITVAAGKRIGLISQIPWYPEEYTVENVLRSAFAELFALKKKMAQLEREMAEGSTTAQLSQYDSLVNRYETGGGYTIDTAVDKICNGLEIPAAMRQRPFAALSGGEKTRVNLARLLLEQTEILLLDEPTNHLDLRSVEWLESYLRTFKGSVLTISHDRFFLDQVVSRIVEISAGKAELYSGNYTFYINERQARFDLQLKQYEQEQAKLKQLGFTVERMKGWGINNRTLYRRAMSIQHRMERIRKTERPVTQKTLQAHFAQQEFQGDEVFSVRDLAMGYGGRTLFSGVDLQVRNGERIALLGDNGAGKTTFLRCLLGIEPPLAGKIKFGPAVKPGYLPQTMAFAHPERTLYDTLLYEKNLTPQAARDRLGAFLFSGEDVFKKVGDLSGGEQSRLRLCMLMDDKINFLVLDEPTNHLDVASREWVECAIDEYEGTLLFVSHDRYFIEKFATRIWLLQDGTIRDFPCGYAKYRSILEHEAMQRVPQPRQREKKPKPVGGARELEKQVRRLEREIDAQEQKLQALDEALAAASSDYQELVRLTAEREVEEKRLDEMMERWEALASELES